MAKKITGFKTRGMNRDLSVSAFNSEFSFENVNLRLSTNEGNTMLSWVNEKGPAQITVTGDTVKGVPVGTAVINRQLVVFTHGDSSDCIFVLQYADTEKTQMECRKLYEGNLDFSTDCPLETIVSYEAEHIQKVYWTDGINQPRLVNIAEDYTGKPASTFDFIPELQLNESVTIERNVSSGGTFAPGVIQYCFTYVNRYRQQSNVAWVSSLYYLTHDDRGASPEDSVTGSFRITIENPDDNFDYLRLYSVQRTSLDLEPVVKLLDDLEINGSSPLMYVDNGTTGSTLDPYELLYVGGKEITAKTIADSDNTLFLGNITADNMMVDDIQDYFLEHSVTPAFSADKEIKLDTMKGVYSNTNMISKGTNLAAITTYKGGETYRFGIQLQKKTGEWSEPVFIGDAANDKYPGTVITGTGYDTVNLVKAQADIPLSAMESGIEGFDRRDYKKIRPVVVFPDIGDRSVICQGVVNPTVFNPEDRIGNSPFAQSSWYFRPYMANDSSNSSDTETEYCILDSETGISKDDARNFNDTSSLNPNPGYYYVIFVNIPETYTNVTGIRERILNRKYLKWTEVLEAWYPEYDQPQAPSYQTGIITFKGAIHISGSLYALFSPEIWKRPDETNEWLDDTEPHKYYRRVTVKYDEGVTINYLDPVQEAYKVTDALKATSNGMLYNSNDTDGDDLMFYFFKDSTVYQATFEPKGDIFVITENTDGNPLAFTHYDSLPTEEGISGIAVGGNAEKRSTVEIQGSRAIYTGDSLFGERVKNPKFKANSQYFVDQSIITMHSPDIEFDTEVQNFNMSNVKMRIVGAVPITANASAHSIRTSSPMLERSHNLGSPTTDFGFGEVDLNIVHQHTQSNIDGNAGNRLVADYLWNDVVVETNTEFDDRISTSEESYDFLVYPWQKQGSLNNDTRPDDVASSTLKVKKESNILYSYNTAFIHTPSFRHYFDRISAQVFLTENNFVMNMRLPQQKASTAVINYYPNVDKVLYNALGYHIHTRQQGSGSENMTTYSPVSMKYKSTSHAVIALNSDNPEGSGIAILPYGYADSGNKGVGKYIPNHTGNTTVWGDSGVSFNQRLLDIEDADNNLFGSSRLNYLWLAELYRDVENPFGGTSKTAIRANRWVPAGEAVDIPASGNVTVNWTEGDTFYQRYDCLKTYPFTLEDQNQLIEILSFMCETKVNIDGRYDRNRGQMDNTNIRPEIFNLLNPVYSQKNNFFTSMQSSQERKDTLRYPNLIAYSKTKTAGADVDLYTNVTLGSVLDLDGDKGEITALRRLNDQLIAFQDTGLSRIMYNSNVALATQQGVPVELANSGKVEGKQYLSDTIGCSDRNTIVTTPSGIYFMDSHDRSIYLFNGQLANLSVQGGMNSWVKANIPSPEVRWDPVHFNNFKGVYDKVNQDVLFIGRDRALAWSEKAGAFTSFYSYGGTPYLNSLDNTGVWIRNDGTLWKHNAGGYSSFFGTVQPFSMTLVGNPEPQTDKIFTNLEFRADVEGEGTYDSTTRKFTPALPFDFLEVWNEYQHGITELQVRNGAGGMTHHSDDGISSLKRKFRMWRCDIPRDNAEVTEAEIQLGIKRFARHPLDRMRNPWIYLKLQKNVPQGAASLDKTEIHDIIMTYFN